MSHQIALNGKVHPDKNRDQLAAFLKKHQIAHLVSNENVYNGDQLDVLISSSKDQETKLYKHVIEKNIPILNEEWMKDVIQAKAWVQPLSQHYMHRGGNISTAEATTAEAAAAKATAAEATTAEAAATKATAVEATTRAPTPTIPAVRQSIESDEEVPHEAPETNGTTVQNACALAVTRAQQEAKNAATARDAAKKAYDEQDAKAVAEQAQKAYNAAFEVRNCMTILGNHGKNAKSPDDQTAIRDSRGIVYELVSETMEAAADANLYAEEAKKAQQGGNWSREVNTPFISEAETQRRQAVSDAETAMKAARKATANATNLRQEAERKAKNAFAVQTAANNKEGSEKEAELTRFREMSMEVPEAFVRAEEAEIAAKGAEQQAVVKANAAGIPFEDDQQRDQSPWGDILESSKAPENPRPHDLIQMPQSSMGGPGACGTIVCSLPRGQLVVTVPHKGHIKAFILPAKYAIERKAFKDGGGLQLEYEDPNQYDSEVMSIWNLDPVLVAVQKAKGSGRTVLGILIAQRQGSTDKLLYNLSRLREIWPAGQVASYVNAVAAKQSQPQICAMSQKALAIDADRAKRDAWMTRHGVSQ